MKSDELSCIAVIPARGGSKSIPRKNVRLFHGKPLISWTVDVAIASGCFDAVWVSTDDSEIADAAMTAGAQVPFLRPPELAGDEVPTAPVIRHALDLYSAQTGSHPRYVFVLEPTAPARQVDHIKDALRLLQESGADSVSGISPVPHHYSIEKQLELSNDGFIEGVGGVPILSMTHRRQDVVPHYAFNGVVWACRGELLYRTPPSLWGENNVGLLIDELYAVDLDNLSDWERGEARMSQLMRKDVDEV